ncbi:hypothetical protein N0V93_001328 [Gnomoniopsis smithogilvyi]|uniref:Uncharacterized protein n=1 Tax=Gnomoniopsis smithogilvyi TaxID=1191159 RepID=A0A9W8Z1W7_9PEZI|nr:hypothetical protein N0V93_001328 [Gnomoniopsis smithogilvyi]
MADLGPARRPVMSRTETSESSQALPIIPTKAADFGRLGEVGIVDKTAWAATDQRIDDAQQSTMLVGSVEKPLLSSPS